MSGFFSWGPSGFRRAALSPPGPYFRWKRPRQILRRGGYLQRHQSVAKEFVDRLDARDFEPRFMAGGCYCKDDLFKCGGPGLYVRISITCPPCMSVRCFAFIVTAVLFIFAVASEVFVDDVMADHFWIPGNHDLIGDHCFGGSRKNQRRDIRRVVLLHGPIYLGWRLHTPQNLPPGGHDRPPWTKRQTAPFRRTKIWDTMWDQRDPRSAGTRPGDNKSFAGERDHRFNGYERPGKNARNVRGYRDAVPRIMFSHMIDCAEALIKTKRRGSPTSRRSRTAFFPGRCGPDGWNLSSVTIRALS